MKESNVTWQALAATSLLALGVSMSTLAETLIPGQCQQTDPKSNVRGIFGGGASLDSIPDTFGCEIPYGSGRCTASFADSQNFYFLEVDARVGTDPETGRLGMYWEVTEQELPDVPEGLALVRVSPISVGTKGSSGGSDCIWTWKEQISSAAGHAFVKSNGQLSGVNAGYFFANTDTATPYRAASRCIPNCREIDKIAGISSPPTCIGDTHTPGVNESVVMILERRGSDGKRVPFSGWQIGDSPNPALRDVDVTNFCVCNHLAVSAEGEKDWPEDENDVHYGEDCACDENYAPNTVNPVTLEPGCKIAEPDEVRQETGLRVVNPWCPSGGSSNRCY